MNNSGKSLLFFIKPLASPKLQEVKKNKKNKRGLENLIVIYDDIDLAIGTIKISYNRGTGGHRGLDSIVKTLKTKEFLRIRIGISPTTSKGRIKKPDGEQKILDFILGKFKTSEMEMLNKTFHNVTEAVKF
jgi:peptidyl-tRNA hydrolase, PTH1 family